MDPTEVFELTTEAEVEEFCYHLQAAKARAPVSLRLTVALTAHRAVQVVSPYDPEEHKRGPIDAAFRKLVGGGGS